MKKFLIVGVMTAVIYFSLFTLLWKIYLIDYRYSISIAYFFAVSVHFLANRYFTFKAPPKLIYFQLIKYGLVNFINYLITLTIVFLVVTILGFNPYSGISIAIIVTTGSSYFLLKLWVFRKE